MSGFHWSGSYADTPGDTDPEGWALMLAGDARTRRERRRYERAARREAARMYGLARPRWWRLRNRLWCARHAVARGAYRAITGFWPCDCECPSCQREDPER